MELALATDLAPALKKVVADGIRALPRVAEEERAWARYLLLGERTPPLDLPRPPAAPTKPPADAPVALPKAEPLITEPIVIDGIELD